MPIARPLLARGLSLVAVLFWATLALAQTGDPEGDPGDAGAQFRQGAILVTLAERLTDELAPVGAALRFADDATSLAFRVKNTGETGANLDFAIIAEDAEFTQPDQRLWAGSISLSPGEARGFTLDLPAGGLAIGDYVLTISGAAEGRLDFVFASPHPEAERLAPGVRPGGGVNLALTARGGTVAASSAHGAFYRAERLIDGQTHYHKVGDWRECGNCGWAAAEGDAQPVLTLRPGAGPVPLAAVVLDTNAMIPSGWNPEGVSAGFPKVVRLSALSGGVAQEIGTFRLRRDFARHLLPAGPGIAADAVRLEILESFGGQPALSEVEIYATAAFPAAELPANLAAPGVGGVLVRFTGFSDDAPAAQLADGDPATPWVSADDAFPQDFTFAFASDGPAYIDHVELIPSESYNGESWPAEVAVALSPDSPLDGFEEVGRMAMPMRPGAHRMAVGREARFVKVRLLSNHGAVKTTLGEIRIVGRPAEGAAEAPAEARREAAEARAGTIAEAEPNDTMATANPLPLGAVLKGEVAPLGERDFFALPPEAVAGATLTVEYDGIPYIRHELGLHGAGGDVLAAFDPGDLPARNARLSFTLTGAERALSLSEPPASIVVVWDTSGSMAGREEALERAVREYIRLAPPSQAIRLVRFSRGIEDVTPGFTTDKAALLAAAEGKFYADGGTPLYEAIQHAMGLLDSRKGNRAVVVMTDGADNGGLWYDDLWRELERKRYRLYTIGLGEGLEDYYVTFGNTGERILRHLALGTDGEAFFARESAALEAFYARIANQLAAPATYLLAPGIETGRGRFRIESTAEQVPRAALPAIHVIFDVSGSMNRALPDGRKRIDVAKQALYTTLDALPEGAPFGLTIYGARVPERAGKDVACEDVLTVKEMGPLAKRPVADFIAGLDPIGGTTPLARSIAHVVRDFRAENGGIVIAITDGIEECDPEPLVTVEQLKSAGLETIELNVIGFDLRDAEAQTMMQQIAALGGGRFYDANDGAALTRALREAIAASYVMRDAAGRAVASGKIDGPAQEVPTGYFTVELATPDAPRRINEVRIAADSLTRMQVNKVGNEIDIVVLDPQKADPRRECGLPAADRPGGAERIERIQAKLNAAGYDTGTPDGVAGRKTREAAAAFRAAQGLAPSDEIGLELERHLDCVAATGGPWRP